MWGVELLVMGGMVLVNGVFAAYELALASVSLARLQVLADEKRGGAASAVYMKRNMEGSLAGVQLGITLVGAIAAAVGGAGAEEVLSPKLQSSLGVSSGTAELLALALVVAPLTAVTIVFGELIPKVFALRNKERVCLALSTPMRWFVTAVWPVVWALESSVTGLMALGERAMKKRGGGVVKSEAAELQELRATAAIARTSRLIGPREERIIVGASTLSTRPIREAMLPAEAISMLDANAEVADALAHATWTCTPASRSPTGRATRRRSSGTSTSRTWWRSCGCRRSTPPCGRSPAPSRACGTTPRCRRAWSRCCGTTRTSPWCGTPAGGWSGW